MKNVLRAVIDTNVFLSALLGSESCGQLYEELKNNSFLPVTSKELMEEIEEVVKRKKFDLTAKEIDDMVTLIGKKSKNVILQHKIQICRDIEDNIFLDCAVAGRADYIVTGDKDLLALSSFRGIHISPPSQFLVVLRQSR